MAMLSTARPVGSTAISVLVLTRATWSSPEPWWRNSSVSIFMDEEIQAQRS